MKFALHSDTHHEFSKKGLNTNLIPDKPKEQVDFVLLAGDIAVGDGAARAAKKYRDVYEAPTFYICGNHEYYGQEITTLNLSEYDEHNLLFLENKTALLPGVRIIGCTLWTSFNIYGPGQEYFLKQNAKSCIGDYRAIRRYGETLTPDATQALHYRSVEYIKNTLNQPYSGRTVVMTHHAPIMEASHPMFRGNDTDACFVNSLYDIIEDYEIDLWVFGHTHFNVDMEIYGTRILSHQAGYPGEGVKGYDKNRIFEL